LASSWKADVSDGHGNTLLSEASAGGAASTIKFLLRAGANPNSQGEFRRTPLWRAAFLGKLDCIQLLLEGGADPRIGEKFHALQRHCLYTKYLCTKSTLCTTKGCPLLINFLLWLSPPWVPRVP
jgi:hypothetical protein